MKPRFILLPAIGLSSCADLEPPKPYVNEVGLQQALETAQRASLYQSQGDCPRNAWQRADLENGFDKPFGGTMTPIVGYGWNSESNR